MVSAAQLIENPQGYMIKFTSEPKLNSNHRWTDCVPFSGSDLFDIFHPRNLPEVSSRWCFPRFLLRLISCNSRRGIREEKFLKGPETVTSQFLHQIVYLVL